jgi:hypothetical protein
MRSGVRLPAGLDESTFVREDDELVAVADAELLRPVATNVVSSRSRGGEAVELSGFGRGEGRLVVAELGEQAALGAGRPARPSSTSSVGVVLGELPANLEHALQVA